MANDKRISALTERTSFSANDYMVLDNAGEGESKKFLASMFTDQFRDMQNILGSKNLLPNKLSTYAENGLTITINADKSITINGTSSADTTVKITQRYNNSGNKMTLQNGDYILSGCTDGNSSSYRMQAIVLKSAAETVLATNYNGDSLFTVNGDDGSASSAQVQISIFVPSGKTLSSKTFYPMVRPASILDNTYIPHAETNAQLTGDVAALNSALNAKYQVNDSTGHFVTLIGTTTESTPYTAISDGYAFLSSVADTTLILRAVSKNGNRILLAITTNDNRTIFIKKGMKIWIQKTGTGAASSYFYTLTEY